MTPHRWAGMAVMIRLKAVDGIGQTAFSDDVRLILPEREFRPPGGAGDHRAAQAADQRARAARAR